MTNIFFIQLNMTTTTINLEHVCSCSQGNPILDASFKPMIFFDTHVNPVCLLVFVDFDEPLLIQ